MGKVKNKNNSKKNKWLHLRLSEEELQKLKHRFEITTYRQFSEFARTILVDQQVTVKTRNCSLDDALEEMIRLRRELNAIGHNYNQVVKKLHSMQHLDEIRIWYLMNEKSKLLFMEKVSGIQRYLEKLYEQWSHE